MDGNRRARAVTRPDERGAMTMDESFFEGLAIKVPDDSLGFVLWRTTHAWQRAVDAALAPTGLTHLRFELLIALAWLTRAGEPLSQRGLADFLQIHPAQVSQVVSAMEAAGLVNRAPSACDRRALALSVTAPGETALRRALPLVEAASRDFFERPGVDAESVRRALVAWLKAS